MGVKFRVDCDGDSEESKVVSFPMKEVIDNIDTRDIMLSCHSHNGHYSDCHAKNVLNDDNAYYLSKNNETFKAQERDWIEFQMNKGTLIQQVCIQNCCGDGQDVKRMSVSVGDGNGKWIPLKSNGQSIIHV